MRRDGSRSAKGLRSACGAATLPARTAMSTSALTPVPGAMPADTGFMPMARMPGRDECAQQRHGNDRLADAGVGAGDENAARHGSPFPGVRTRQLHDRMTLRACASVRPSTHARRPPRTSPERGRPAASPRAPTACAASVRVPSGRAAGRASHWSRPVPSTRASALRRRRTSAVNCSMSITGSAKPAATSMSPTSCMSVKRLVCVWPSTRAKAARISFSVSGPNVVKVNSPPTLSTRRISANARGRSLTHCNARLLQMRSKATPENGSALMSPQTKSGADWPPAAIALGSRRREQGPCAPCAIPCRCHHRQRGIECHDARAGIAYRQFADRLAGTATGVEDHSRRDPDVVEARRHARADFALQHRRRVVRRRGPCECAPHHARIHVARIGCRKARLSGTKEVLDQACEFVAMRQERRVRRPGQFDETRLRQGPTEPASRLGRA